MASLSAAVFDPVEATLSADEKAFFRDVNPFGYILFARHCASPEAVKRLVGELKSLSGRDRLPILIDQEGGRVARLKPPHWPKYPPAATFANLYAEDKEKAKRATYLNARLIAYDLYELGITVDCAPLADIPVKGAHDVIGDRAFGHEPESVIALARAQADGLMDGGIVPVLKHIPGHGRAFADSHHELPVVKEPLETLRKTDFVPFKALADLPMGMTAHVLYTAIDEKNMATVSKPAIDLIRGELGFKGFLFSDDLAMKAMEGSLDQRARAALAAGCDAIIHCNGSLADKQQVARGLSPVAVQRAEAAMASVGKPKVFDIEEARNEITVILSEAKDLLLDDGVRSLASLGITRGEKMPHWFIDASSWVIPVVLAITMHEAAHGWMADRFGDETARRLGRVTLNPLKHVDKFGTIIFPGILLLMHSPFVFGYAKPVPVNFSALKPPRIGMAAVALAGPGMNLLLAIISGVWLAHTPESSRWLYESLSRSLLINCILALFNMLPILPLDGGRVVDSVLPAAPRRWFRRLERYGIVIVLLAFLVPPFFGHNVMQELIAEPIYWLVEQVLWLTGNGQ